MLDLSKLVTRHEMQISGVVHVGAHYGQEFPLYERLGATKIVCFEPCSTTFRILEQTIAKLNCEVMAFPVALGSASGTAEMYVETINTGASNSLLKPKLHLERYPHIVFPERETVQVARLDDFFSDIAACNMLCLDVQGYELKVLQGAKKSLEQIDYIVTEVNLDPLYADSVLFLELDEYLRDTGFMMVAQVLVPENWGDALYIRQ